MTEFIITDSPALRKRCTLEGHQAITVKNPFYEPCPDGPPPAPSRFFSGRPPGRHDRVTVLHTPDTPGLHYAQWIRQALHPVPVHGCAGWDWTTSKILFNRLPVRKNGLDVNVGSVVIDALRELSGILGEPRAPDPRGSIRYLAEYPPGPARVEDSMLAMASSSVSMPPSITARLPLKMVVADIKTRRYIEAPPLPPDLPDIVSDCATRLDLNPGESIRILSGLYYGGYISYPFTRSREHPSAARNRQACLHPVSPLNIVPSGLDATQRAVFDAIRGRYRASINCSAVWQVRRLTLESQDSAVRLIGHQARLTSPGFRRKDGALPVTDPNLWFFDEQCSFVVRAGDTVVVTSVVLNTRDEVRLKELDGVLRLLRYGKAPPWACSMAVLRATKQFAV